MVFAPPGWPLLVCLVLGTVEEEETPMWFENRLCALPSLEPNSNKPCLKEKPSQVCHLTLPLLSLKRPQ